MAGSIVWADVFGTLATVDLLVKSVASCHIAEKCYYRFDPDFVPFQKQGSSSQGSYKPPSQRPVAAVATANSEYLTDDWWYPDSGLSYQGSSSPREAA